MTSSSRPVYKLILHPGDPESAPEDLESVRNALWGVGLIADQFFHVGKTHYFPGDKFLNLITFLGCSPAVALEPLAGRDKGSEIDAVGFCNVHLSGPYVGARFRTGAGKPVPRCPKCRRPQPVPAPILSAWEADPAGSRWSCLECGHETRPDQLDWRHGAGCGRLFVEIWGVHPHEAVPGDQLLDALRGIAADQWSYFYAYD